MSISVKPIPLDLRKELYDYYTPWEIGDRIFNEMKQKGFQGTYKKVQVLPVDPEWRFVWRYFHHDKPNKYGIKRIFCIHQIHQQKTFELNLSNMETESHTFKPIWNQEPSRRAKAIERWKQIADVFSPFDVMELDGRRSFKEVKIIPLWYGSSKSVLDSIDKSGFLYFEQTSLEEEKPTITDDGFFENGIHFTSSARYASDIYSKGHLLLAWVSMREPFPVVGGPKKEELKTLCSKEVYNAYYVSLTLADSSNSLGKNYCTSKKEETVCCDEIIVFHKFQILPRFWIELEVELPYALSDTPQFVNELIPHLMKLLQNLNVDRDQKLRNYLGRELGTLLTLEEDDYLEEKHKILYEKLTQILDSQGEVNRQVSQALTGVSRTNMISLIPQPDSVISTPEADISHQLVTPEVQNDSTISKPEETHNKAIKNKIHSKKYREKDYNKLDVIPSKQTVISSTEDKCFSIPSIAFGKADWERYFGDIGEEPTLPANIDEILNEPCSFWPDKKVKETHLLVLIPNMVNCKPFTLDCLGKLIRKPRSGHATKYRYYSDYVKEELCDKPCTSHWVLMTREAIPGTLVKCLGYSDQCDLIASHNQKTGLSYEVPYTLEAITSILVHYVKTGERLYTYDKLRKEWIFTMCQENVCNKKWPYVPIRFAAGGLGVVCSYYFHKVVFTCGMAGVRRF